MTTAEIYKRYHITPNLQRHHLRVAALAKMICNAWTGPEIDTDDIIKACLLHDIANIIKMDFDNHLEFLEEEENNIDYWCRKQKEFITQYGDDEFKAAAQIRKDLMIDGRIEALLTGNRFIYVIDILNSNNWPRKIIKYADMRIGPFGILSLQERMDEAKERYQKYHGSSMSKPNKDELIKAAFKIEEQLRNKTDINFDTISNPDLEALFDQLLIKEIN